MRLKGNSIKRTAKQSRQLAPSVAYKFANTKCFFSPIYWRYFANSCFCPQKLLGFHFPHNLKAVNGVSLWNGWLNLPSLPAMLPESYWTHWSLMQSQRLSKLWTRESHFYHKLYSRVTILIGVNILKEKKQKKKSSQHLKEHKNIKCGLSHCICKCNFQSKMNSWIDIIYTYITIMHIRTCPASTSICLDFY